MVPSILTGGSGEEKEIAIDKVKLLMIGTRSGEQTSLYITPDLNLWPV